MMEKKKALFDRRKETADNVIGTDFTQGPVMPLLLRFLLPFLLASILNSLYNTVDTIIVGQFLGSEGIVAVSMGGKMLNLFTQISTTLAGAGQVLISQMLGAKRRNELNATIGTLFSELILLSVLIAAVTLCFADDIIRGLNTPLEAAPSALAYLQITCIGLPLIFGYNAVSSVLRGMGDSRNPLIFIAIATVINTVLDIVFILWFRMGVAGTALATVIAQGSSLLFSLIVLYRRREHFGFDFRLRSFAIHWDKLRIMLRIGIPMALRCVFIICTQIYMFRFINGFGLIPSAAYNVGDKIYHLANIFSISTRQAAGTLVAQNIGAGRNDRVKQTVRCVCIVVFSATAVLILISVAFPITVFSLFTTEVEVLSHARAFMLISCVIYTLSAWIAPYESVVSGTGNARLSFLSGLLDGVVLRVLFSFFFGFYLGMGVEGFFLGEALARLGIILVEAPYYHTGAWQRFKKLVDV